MFVAFGDDYEIRPLELGRRELDQIELEQRAIEAAIDALETP